MDHGSGRRIYAEHLTVKISRRGEMTSLRLAGNDREYMAGMGNRFAMVKDVNTCYDAWEIGSMAESMPVELDGCVRLEICPDERGAALRVERQLHDSVLVQKILLAHDAKRVDFETEMNWQEKHKMLKVCFPLAVRADMAVHETQYGFIRRPTHRSRQHDKDQYEVCNHRYTLLGDPAGGAAVLNDGKYGVSVRENEIGLTLLRAPMMPDMHADRGTQRFTYSIYPFAGAFEESGVLAEAAQLNGQEDIGLGLLESDQANVVVDSVRISETKANALLVRAYEAMGKPCRVKFAAHERIYRAFETDMTEENARPADLGGVAFAPFEIKTFLFELDE